MKKLAIILLAFALGCSACSHDKKDRGNHGNNERNTCQDSHGSKFDIYGTCAGTLAKYCDEDTLEYTEEDCSRNKDGKTACGQFEYQGDKYYGCIEGGGNNNNNNNNNVITCKDGGKSYDSFGVCDGNVAKYCDNDGNFVAQDCSKEAENTVCGDFKENDQTFKACIKPNSQGCGSITSNGVCEGASLKFCESGDIVTRSCPYKCAYTDQDYADCYERCGTVDSNGKCDGSDKVAYCGFAYNNPGHQDGDEVDVLVVLQCKGNETCAAKVNGEYDCIEKSGN